MGLNISINIVEWLPCWRIIPSRFPPIGLYERVAKPEDLEAVFRIEELTNLRIRDQVGDLRLVPPEDRVSGPGTSAIMAAFTHLSPGGSRFTDGTFGVYYAGDTLATAVEETKYRRVSFMRATNEDPMELDMRVYLADLVAPLHDLRGRKAEFPIVYRPDNYSAGQRLAVTLRQEGSNGIAYDSVRKQDGACVAVFRPRLLTNCRQERHLSYVWDGHRISSVYEKRPFEP
jgi:hypothetical protein